MADFKRIDLAWPFLMNTAPSFGNFTLDATTDALEFICQAKEGAAITRIGVRLGVITGTTPTYRVSIQGVDASGNPDGTIKGGASPASATFSPSALGWTNGSWHWVTLDNAYTVARGEWIALVIDYSSGTVDGANNASFTSLLQSTVQWGHPYPIQNNAGARAKQDKVPVYGYGSSGTAYGNPMETFNTHSVSSISTPDEIGCRFTLPAGWGATFKVLGARLFHDMPSGNTADLKLYSGTTALQSVAIDADHQSSGGWHDIYFDEPTLSTLDFGTEYILAFAPSSVGSFSIYSMEVDAAADMAAWPGGDSFLFASRTDSGAWSNDALRRPLILPILDDWTEPAAAPPQQGYFEVGEVVYQ